MSSGDWSDSLFKPEKGDSLGDGSWGRESEEPELAPVAWDKLPEAPSKDKVRARLATPAPGSQKESGLLDIKALAPDLAKGMKDGEPAIGGSGSAAPSAGAARLATAAKGSAGSGLIDVQKLVEAQEHQESSKKTGPEAVFDALSESPSAMTAGSRSSSLVDQPTVSPSNPDPAAGSMEPAAASRGPLLLIMGLLAVAVAGLAIYIFTQ